MGTIIVLQLIKLYLKNRSSKTIFVDLGNTFIMRNGTATPYYIPTSMSSTTSSSSGVSVNLGSVAGALGIGGALGTIAGGIGVGGGSTSGTVSTTYSQRVVSIPPMSVKELTPQLLFKDLGKLTEGFYYSDFGSIYSGYPKDLMCVPVFDFPKTGNAFMSGMSHDFSEESTPFNLGFYISYSNNENCTDEKNMPVKLFLRRIVGFGTRGADSPANASRISMAIPDFKKCISFISYIKTTSENDVMDITKNE